MVTNDTPLSIKQLHLDCWIPFHHSRLRMSYANDAKAELRVDGDTYHIYYISSVDLGGFLFVRI